MDGVLDYLPSPTEMTNDGFLEKEEDGEKTEVPVVFN